MAIVASSLLSGLIALGIYLAILGIWISVGYLTWRVLVWWEDRKLYG